MKSLGIDVGSTTVKAVLMSESGEILYKRYERHNARVRELLKEKVHFKLSSLIFKAVLKTMEEKEPALAEKICRALSDGSEKTVADLSPSAIKEHEKILGAQSEMKAALKNFAAQNKEACAAMLGELTASFVKKL